MCWWCLLSYKGSIIVCATNKLSNICASLNKCSTFVQETPVIHLQQSRITPLASQPIATSKFKAYRPCHVTRRFYAHARNVPHPHNHLSATASSVPLLQICPSSSGGSRPLEIKMYPLSSESMIPSSRSKCTPPPAKYDPLLQMS